MLICSLAQASGSLHARAFERVVAARDGVDYVAWSIEPSGHFVDSISVVGADGILLNSRMVVGNNSTQFISSESFRIQKSRPEAGHFRQIDLTKFDGKFENELIFRWNYKTHSYSLIHVARRIAPVQYSDLAGEQSEKKTIESIGTKCDVSVPGNKELGKFSEALIEKVQADADGSKLDTSCNAIRNSVIAAMPTLSGRSGLAPSAYAECLGVVQPTGEIKERFKAALSELRRSNLEKIKCTEAVPFGKRGMYTPSSGEISFDEKWVRSNPSQSEITGLLFHELLHAADIKVESLTKNLEICCSKKYDPSDIDCKSSTANVSLKKEELKDPNDTTTLDSFKQAAEVAKREATSHATDSSVPAQTHKTDGDPKDTGDVRNGPPLPTFLDPTIPQLGESTTTVTKKPVHAVDMHKEGRSEHEAAEAHVVIRSTVKAAKQAFQNIDFDKMAASTVGVPTASAQEVSPKARNSDRATSPSVSQRRSATAGQPGQMVFETKVVGENTDGTPKLELPNGKLLPSYKAFGGLQVASDTVAAAPPSSSAGLGASARRESAAPSASRGATIASSVRSSAPASPRTQAGDTLSAAPGGGSNIERKSAASHQQGSTATGGDSGGGSSFGSSNGGSTGNIQRAVKGAGSTPTRSTASEKVIRLEDLKAHSHSMSELSQVKVESWSDVKSVIKAAKTPQQLLKQDWFIKRLRDPEIRAQVIDNGVGYGSNDPIIRYQLKYLTGQ